MSKYWTTREGDEIEYKKLKNDHLLNILKWIKRRAKNGMIVTEGGGNWFEPDTFWYDEYEIKGKEVKERYDYAGLLKEANRRRLFNQ